jgi:hypothetical protein
MVVLLRADAAPWRAPQGRRDAKREEEIIIMARDWSGWAVMTGDDD